jgi:hypothetical protein
VQPRLQAQRRVAQFRAVVDRVQVLALAAELRVQAAPVVPVDLPRVAHPARPRATIPSKRPAPSVRAPR